MSSVNQTFLRAITSYERHVHSVDKLLLRFFSSVQIRRFREVQATEGFLISGSVALQFFARVEWHDSDLDLYCYPGHFKQLVGLLLMFRYQFAPLQGGPTDLAEALRSATHTLQNPFVYTSNGISSVISFTKVVLGVKRKVQVVVCKNAPFEAILSFHSSCVMNFISATHAFSLYPYSTLHLHENVQLVTSYRAQAALRKYSDCGWMLVTSSAPSCGLRLAYEFARDRAVGDKATWIMSLGGIGVTPDPDEASLKWLIAHSWSHGSSYHRRVSIVVRTGTRCGWKWPLAYGDSAQHLIMHTSKDRPEVSCVECEEGVLRNDQAYIHVHNSLARCPQVTNSEADQSLVGFLRGLFRRMPMQGPVSFDMLPDSDAAFMAFRQIQTVLAYYRIKPQVVVSFQFTKEAGESGFVMSVEIFLPKPTAEFKSVAWIHPVYGRFKPVEGLSIEVSIGSLKKHELTEHHHLFGTCFAGLISPPAMKDELPLQHRLILEAFVQNTFSIMPRRTATSAEIVPVAESKKHLLSSLSALFIGLDCRPNLSVAFQNIENRSDIHVFTVVTVTVPDHWPDLDKTCFGVLYNIKAVRRLELLGFSIHMVKGGRIFM
ncbi:hypothetical protein PM082_023430 [Marasmius tenuissimus]|nr:hypothetical protein PM082_023430 [Marasmius tenuissimus]